MPSAMSSASTFTTCPSRSQVTAPGCPIAEANGQPGEEAGDPVPAVQGPGDRSRLTAAVAVVHHLGGQRPQQPVQVAAVGRGEEPPRDLLALRARRLETRFSLVDTPPGPAAHQTQHPPAA
jgi:hypothetical protein